MLTSVRFGLCVVPEEKLQYEFVLCTVAIYHISASYTVCSTSATISQKLQLTLLLFLHHQLMGFLD